MNEMSTEVTMNTSFGGNDQIGNRKGSDSQKGMHIQITQGAFKIPVFRLNSNPGSQGFRGFIVYTKAA